MLIFNIVKHLRILMDSALEWGILNRFSYLSLWCLILCSKKKKKMRLNTPATEGSVKILKSGLRILQGKQSVSIWKFNFSVTGSLRESVIKMNVTEIVQERKSPGKRALLVRSRTNKNKEEPMTQRRSARCMLSARVGSGSGRSYMKGDSFLSGCLCWYSLLSQAIS